jgi:Mn2+/Fe2+ NRAMP family transporter
LTASLGGSELGLVLLWAALAGGVLKFILNEGLARWQMATNTTLLEGWVERLGGWIQWVFLFYLVIWTFVVAGALMTACGVAGTGLLPIGDPGRSKIIWGIAHSVVGLILVRVGGFRLFEIMMSVCIAVMFVAVVVTAVLVRPDWSAAARGVVIPVIPAGGQGWVLGVLGGVGGTVTLLSYGYWIREEGRTGEHGVRACRLDLAVAYALTAIFGVAMIIIGSRVTLEGKGPTAALVLAGQLAEVLGPTGKWVFLAGFWGAVFSSLLGVWQSVPYLFADFLALRRRLSADERDRIDYKQTRAYRVYQVALAVVPVVLLWHEVRQVQLAYAVLGALFMPLLALTLLIMNNNRRWVGRKLCNGWLAKAGLTVTLLLFAYMGLRNILERLSSFF